MTIRKIYFDKPYSSYNMTSIYGVYESPTLSAFFDEDGKIPKMTHNSNRIPDADPTKSITLKDFLKRIETLDEMIQVAEKRHGLILDSPNTPGEFCVSQVQNSFHQNVIANAGMGYHAGGQAYFGLGQITAEKLREHKSSTQTYYSRFNGRASNKQFSTRVVNNETMVLFGMDIFTGLSSSIGSFKHSGVNLGEALVESGYKAENKKGDEGNVVKKFDYLLTGLSNAWTPYLESLQIENDSRLDVNLNNIIAAIFARKLVSSQGSGRFYRMKGYEMVMSYMNQWISKASLFSTSTTKIILFMEYALQVIDAQEAEKGIEYIESLFKNSDIINPEIFTLPAHILQEYFIASTAGFSLTPQDSSLDMNAAF